MSMSYAQTARPKPQTGQKKFTRSLAFHLMLVLAVSVILYFLFFSSLAIITRHGNDAKVPNLVGKDIRQAIKMLDGMGFDIRVDSTYNMDKKALTVLNQSPDVGDVVKQGRIIFLTVNKTTPPETPMPNLVNLSYRSAALILNSNKLILGDTTLQPDLAAGAILDQLYRGKSIRPGQMIPQGSRIDLIIGAGLSNEINMPDVISMTYAEAVVMLNGNGLKYAAIFDADVRDTASAKVYQQTPNAISDLGTTTRILQGDVVEIFVGQNPADSTMEQNRNAWKKNLYNTPPTAPDTTF